MLINRKKLFLAVSSLLPAVVLLAGVYGQDRDQKSDRREKSLLRTDLLQKQPAEPPSTFRNIFTTAPAAGPAEERTAGMSENTPQPGDMSPAGTEAAAPERDSFRLDLQYIGYIQSRGGLVALIFLEGTAFAVEKGELLAEGIEVGKITPKELEILGPGPEKNVYPLQGEER